MQNDYLIGPRIERRVKLARGHCGLLLQVLHVELGSFGDDSLHPEALVGVALGKTVADHRLVEGLQGLMTCLAAVGGRG